MEEINQQINRIQKEIEEIGEQLAIISGIIIEFFDETEWDIARKVHKSNNEIDEVWGRRKPYLVSQLGELAKEKDYLREKENHLRVKKNHLREEKNLLLRKEIQLNENGL